MSDDPATQSWHLDRRVPVALIVTILFQTGLGIWWMADTSARIAQLERAQVAVAPQADRLTRVEVRVENIQAGIEEIKRLLRPPPTP